ncbi:MAG: hypothetical protein HYY55_04165 [Candidatus Niyogibacteria bacterium]|nr:MAG: hypothetical protein HYY55_04165 [Candidatus Niyogibacteria bacterium]
MKKEVWLISLIVGLFALATSGATSEIKKGDTIKVTSPELVIVKNLKPIKNGPDEFAYGDMCHLKTGGKITIIAENRDRVLVRYTISGNVEGSSCPNDTILFFPKLRFKEMADEQKREVQKILEEKKLIEELLGQ